MRSMPRATDGLRDTRYASRPTSAIDWTGAPGQLAAHLQPSSVLPCRNTSNASAPDLLDPDVGALLDQPRLRGTISWPGFGPNGEDWLGFVFVVTEYSGTAYTSNPEGTLEWVPVEQVMQLPLWDGDRHFLPLVFDADPRSFHGVMPYRDGCMVSWNFSRV